MASVAIVDISNNGGGLNTFNSPDKIGNDEIVPRSKNVRTQGESVFPREGYVTYADEVVGSDEVSHLTYYRRNDTANNRFVMCYNDEIYFSDPTDVSPSWSQVIAPAYTTSTDTTSVNYRDWLFLFNAVDKPVRLEGTTASQPFIAPDTLTVDTFLPRFGIVYNNILFVAGVPSAPNVVYASRASTAAAPELIYDFSGASGGLGDADTYLFNSEITGFQELSGALVIFTKDRAYYIEGLVEIDTVVTYEPKPISGADGAIRHEATTVVENDVYYLTPQGEIRSVRRGFSDTLSMLSNPLSIRIQAYLDNALSTDQTKAFMMYNSSEKEFHLYVQEVGGFFNTLRIVGNTSELDESGVPKWYRDDNVAFASGTVFEGRFYAGSAVEGFVFRLNDGFADQDTGSIATVRSSKDFTTNDPIAIKTFRGVRAFFDVNETSFVVFKIYVDDVLVKTTTIDGSAVYGAGENGGGIGTNSIGDDDIGSEGQEPGSDIITNVNETWVDMRIRKRGKKMRVDIETNGVNQYYKLREMQYWFSRTSPLFYTRAN